MAETVTVEACEVESEMLAPVAVAAIVPCVEGSGANDVVQVTVTNTDDETNLPVTYTVTLGGQVKTITNLADGASESVLSTGLAVGDYKATVVGADGTVMSNTVTVANCAEEGDVLGDVIVVGGQGADTGVVLANTGESSNPIINMIIGLGMLGLTFSVAILSRRQNA